MSFFGIPVLFDIAHLHFAAVHFPIGLLLTSVILYLWARLKSSKTAELIAVGLLIAGTLFSYAAVASGVLAEEGVVSHGTYDLAFEIHEKLGYGVAGFYTLLSLWGFAAYRRPGSKVIPLFLILLLLGAAGVGLQGYVGGILGHEAALERQRGTSAQEEKGEHGKNSEVRQKEGKER